MRTHRNVAVLAVLAWAAVASAQVRDSIKYGRNEFKSGITVIAENWDKVIYKVASGAQESIPADQIREIGYGDMPSSFRSAIASLERRKFGEALQQFRAAAKDTAARKFWLGQHTNYHIGRLLYRLGGIDPKNYGLALAAYAEVEKAAAKGRFTPPARLGMGMCYLRMGNTAKANEVFAGLAKQPFGPDWAFRGKLGLVRVKSAGPKTRTEAIADAAKLVDQAANPALRLEAKLALAEAQKAAGQYAQARRSFDEVAKNAPEDDVALKAAAYNGVGDCYRAGKDVQNAKWAYLRVRCVYFEEPEETPRAMEGLAWCFKQLRDAKRLGEIVAELKKDYPNSVYVVMAQRLLK